LVGKRKTSIDIRKMIESSIESIIEARKKGRNSIAIQLYPI